MTKKPKQPKSVEALTHDEATRRNIPTAEYQSLVDEEVREPKTVYYSRGVRGLEAEKARRNRDLDPQLVWRGKDEQDWSELVVQAPPLYIQEKVHPKVLIDDLMRRTAERSAAGDGVAETGGMYQLELDLFADFNGIPDEAAKTEFYQHDANWTNRMILGDSLQVMASLAEREGLRGKVQCIYLDPPYGIKFNSNFQWSTTSRDVKDGKAEHITREPEQVKAFRDTWRDGIHSYLTYLRDRLTVCRDLLTDSGSIFVQIGDENVHRVRALMDEVFGEDGHVAMIAFTKGATGLSASGRMPARLDYILWYGKDAGTPIKYRQLYTLKSSGQDSNFPWVILPTGERTRCSQYGSDLPVNVRFGQDVSLTKPGPGAKYEIEYVGRKFDSGKRWWGTTKEQLERALKSDRIIVIGNSLRHLRYLDESSLTAIGNLWDGFLGQNAPVYVVQTNTDIVQRCLLMTTDPGDLVLDPTCGSGTTAYVAEQWGRRWITIDTSRVALALARARIMGARYPYYVLADEVDRGQYIVDGNTIRPQNKQQYRPPSTDHQPLSTNHYSLKQGFVYKRVPHITLKSIANNAEIDVIWERFEEQLKPLRELLTEAIAAIDPDWLENWRATQNYDVELPDAIQEWEVPREPGFPWPEKAAKALEKLHAAGTDKARLEQLGLINRELGRKLTLDDLPEKPYDFWNDSKAVGLHREFWELRIARQKEIDASIAANADFEYLYDKPYEDKSKVRVAGPFTVESLSPHRVLGVDENDELIDPLAVASGQWRVDSKTGRKQSTTHYPLSTSSQLSTSGGAAQDFAQIILENLRTAGVQQAHKEDKIDFISLNPWPGHFICAEGRYEVVSGQDIVDSGKKTASSGAGKKITTNHSPLTTNHSRELRAGIFIGPEFGTVSRPDLVEAAREAADSGFDVLIACAFSYDAQCTELNKLGRIPILKARMNADLHMATDLKNTGKGNLFVIFGEPDITVASEEWIVDSEGRRIAPYDIFTLVSGVDGLAKINGLDREDLQRYAQLSNRREIWDYLSDAASRIFGTGKHRGGASPQKYEGVSTVAWHCAGITGGTGNVRDLVAKIGDVERAGLRELVDRLCGDQPNASRTDEIPVHSQLTTIHSPLSTSPALSSSPPLPTPHYPLSTHH